MTIARTYLFVPGNRPERYAKACAAGADHVIVDLEDAVPEAEKASARDALARWLTPAAPVIVRINAASTPWFDDDLGLCERSGVAGVMIPKCESRDMIARVVEHLAPGAKVIPLIETARGFANVMSLAEASGVDRFAFGSIDFQLDLGIQGDGEELLYFRSQLVLASRVGGIAPAIDGVTTAIDDVDRLRAETLRARRLGFGAKLCIHPRQVPVVATAFAPSDEEVQWAKRVVAAAAASHGAAVAMDGRMIDRPVILRAEDIVRDAQRARRSDSGS